MTHVFTFDGVSSVRQRLQEEFLNLVQEREGRVAVPFARSTATARTRRNALRPR